MVKVNYKNLIVLTTLSLSLGACAQGTGLLPNAGSMDSQASQTDGAATTGPAQEKAFNRFPDIPVPTRAQMDTARTLVFGSGDTWFGQLSLETAHNANAMFDFYKQELGSFGWQEVTSVRAPVSVLTYERQGRVLSIQIQPASLTGASITLTVSPRRAPSAVTN